MKKKEQDIFQNFEGKRNRTILEKIFKEGKDLSPSFVNSYWKKIKYPHRKNPESEHLLSIYLKSYKKIDSRIAEILLTGYKDINYKSFKNHPLIVAIREGHIEILPLLLSKINLFFKTSKTNKYLLSDVYEAFGARDISEIIEIYTDAGISVKSRSQFFKFLFRNYHVCYDFFQMKSVKKFISELVKEKISNKKDFFSLNEYLSKNQELIIHDEKNFLNITDAEESGRNYGIFLVSNYTNGKLIPNIGFDFKDKILVSEINDTFTREKISFFVNEIKMRMIIFYGICENFVLNTRFATFNNILNEIEKKVIEIDEKENIFQFEEPDKNMFITLTSRLFCHEIMWFIRDKINKIEK